MKHRASSVQPDAANLQPDAAHPDTAGAAIGDRAPLSVRDYELDPSLAPIVAEELARVQPQHRAAADIAIQAHLASGFVGTHAQHAAKWSDVLRPFQMAMRRSVHEIELKRSSSGSDAIALKAGGKGKIDDNGEGRVVAVVSKMGVVDRDGDVVMPGAIVDGTKVKLSAYDHDVITEGQMPVGVGTINIQGDEAVLSAQYFMNTTRGRDAFEAVKAMGPDCEWSIGYLKKVREAPMTAEWRSKGARRLIAGMDLMESSPVFLGANQYTQTLATKQADGDPGDENAPMCEEDIDDPTHTAAVKGISKRSDAIPEEGTHKYGRVPFADPVNNKYPIDTEEHIRAAWNYIHKQENADKYSADERKLIVDRIAAAWRKKIDPAGPPSADDKKPAESKAAEDAEAARLEAQQREAERIGRELETKRLSEAGRTEFERLTHTMRRYGGLSGR